LLANGVSRAFRLDARWDALAVCCLSHDIGYILREADDITKLLNDAITSDFCCAMEGGRISLRIDPDALIDMAAQMGLSREAGLDIKRHGSLSAIELFSLLKKDARTKYAEVLQALALHDNPDIRLRASREPLALVLTLADELQDWARPVDGGGEMIADFNVQTIAERLLVSLTIARSREISVLQLVHEKAERLRRFTFDTCAVSIEFEDTNLPGIPLHDLVEQYRRTRNGVGSDGGLVLPHECLRGNEQAFQLCELADSMVTSSAVPSKAVFFSGQDVILSDGCLQAFSVVSDKDGTIQMKMAGRSVELVKLDIRDIDLGAIDTDLKKAMLCCAVMSGWIGTAVRHRLLSPHSIEHHAFCLIYEALAGGAIFGLKGGC